MTINTRLFDTCGTLPAFAAPNGGGRAWTYCAGPALGRLPALLLPATGERPELSDA